MRSFKTSAPRFLIVKMSSLGDILLSLNVAQYLKTRYPKAHLTWALEERMQHLVESSPYVDEVIALSTKSLKEQPWKILQTIKTIATKVRRQSYDVVVDLQGNCKSGLVTLLAKSSCKIGWGRKSVAEWPNLLVTHHKIKARKELVRSEQYLAFVKDYLQDEEVLVLKQHLLKDSSYPHKLSESSLKIMVCLGSRWPNKQLSEETWSAFLKTIDAKYHPSWVFIWGSSLEQVAASKLATLCGNAQVIGGLPFATWQGLMQQMSVVISVDSSALHLAGLSCIPTFSVYGPSASRLYKPSGDQHAVYQGSCPYGEVFTTRCSKLRTCPTGACIKDIAPGSLIEKFERFLATLDG